MTEQRSGTKRQTAGWRDAGQVEWYTRRIGRLEARLAGEQMLTDLLPPAPRRVLDLGCGDGRLAGLVLEHRPMVESVVAIDRSPPMLALARDRFAGDERVTVLDGDLDDPIGAFGAVDLVVSGFVIHHLEHGRKRSLFGEIAEQLRPGGRFLNLEVVSSASELWHAEFLEAIGRSSDDPEDRLASVVEQSGWMRDAGLVEVDCLWRWRGFALLVGDAPAVAA